MALFAGFKAQPGRLAVGQAAGLGSADRCGFQRAPPAPKGKCVARRSDARKRQDWQAQPIGRG